MQDQYSPSAYRIVSDLEEPTRAELCGVARLEQHLAAAQVVFSEPRQDPVLTSRVLKNGRVLLESHRIMARAIQQEPASGC